MPDPISPFGFERVESPRLTMVGDLASLTPDLEAAIAATGHEVSVLGTSSKPGINSRRRPPLPELISELRPYSGIITHPGLASGPPDEASLLLNLAKAGVPIAGPVSPEMQAILPDGLASLIENGTIDDLLDSERREVLSVRL